MKTEPRATYRSLVHRRYTLINACLKTAAVAYRRHHGRTQTIDNDK